MQNKLYCNVMRCLKRKKKNFVPQLFMAESNVFSARCITLFDFEVIRKYSDKSLLFFFFWNPMYYL